MVDCHCVYRSLQFCSLCTRVFDRGDTRAMKFDDFIQCCVMLRSLTEGFKRLDTNRSGTITINYEQVCALLSWSLPYCTSHTLSLLHTHSQFLEMAIDNTL